MTPFRVHPISIVLIGCLCIGEASNAASKAGFAVDDEMLASALGTASVIRNSYQKRT